MQIVIYTIFSVRRRLEAKYFVLICSNILMSSRCILLRVTRSKREKKFQILNIQTLPAIIDSVTKRCIQLYYYHLRYIENVFILSGFYY